MSQRYLRANRFQFIPELIPTLQAHLSGMVSRTVLYFLIMKRSKASNDEKIQLFMGLISKL
jgi:hypothetical protein